MTDQHQAPKIIRASQAALCIIFSFCGIALSSKALAHTFPTSHVVAAIAVGDVNGDGIDDIATCGDTTDNVSTVDVLLGKGDGTFQFAKVSSVDTGPGAIALGDFNLDGNLDIVTANFGNASGPGKTISVLLGYGDGTFHPRHNFPAGRRPNSVVTSDLNGDGFPDLVVGESAAFAVFLGNGSGAFHSRTDIELPDFSDRIALGDINADGMTDVLAGNSRSYVSYSLGHGDGSFEPSALTTSWRLVHPFLTDLNGDGFADLLVIDADSPDGWYVLINQWDRYNKFDIKAYHWYVVPISDFTSGDFNNDGKIDFAVTKKDTEGSKELIIELGQGDWFFQSLSNPVDCGDVIATGHFDSDSVLDLVGGGGESMTVRTAYGRGDGTFVRQPPSL